VATELGDLGGCGVTSIERTAYPRFRRFLSARELHVFYTPQPEEIAWARGQVRSDEHLLALMVQAKQVEVLELQASDLRESLGQRQRDADERHRNQAATVTAWFDLPILDVRTFFHYVTEKWEHGDWDTRELGGPVERIRVMPPQADRFVEVPGNVGSQMSDISDSNYVVSIEFTDAAGNRWARDPHGALIPRS
jgi:hypothetical protein